MKGKIFLVIALYMVLGVVAFVDFGFQSYLTELVGWGPSAHEPVGKKLIKNITIQTHSSEEVQDSLPEPEETD